MGESLGGDVVGQALGPRPLSRLSAFTTAATLLSSRIPMLFSESFCKVLSTILFLPLEAGLHHGSLERLTGSSQMAPISKTRGAADSLSFKEPC